MYDVDFSSTGFSKNLAKYKKKNRGSKLLEKALMNIFNQLIANPRDTSKSGIHPLHGKMKGFWSISTGLNGNSDRCIYSIDDETKTVFLLDIGDHSIYENVLTFEEINNMFFK